MPSSDIRSRRRALGLPQHQLAVQLGVSTGTVRRWERALEMPNPAQIQRLSLVLGIAPQDIEAAQLAYSQTVTPGEGYTTGVAANGTVFPFSHEPPTDTFRVLDLFCGSGGLSYGFELAEAFTTVCGIDLLPDRLRTFLANHRHAVGIAGDIRSFPATELTNLSGGIDVVVGGPPCQGFSSIRPFRTLTEGDPRNSLAEHYVLVIASLKPRWFLFENVVGLLTHESGQRLEALLVGFSAAGYKVSWRIMNAALYGVPQSRERIVIVGNRLGIDFHWPEPSHRLDFKSMAGTRREIIRTTPLFSNHLHPAVTVKEAIDDLPPVSAGEEATTYLDKAANYPYQRLMREGSSSVTLHKATSHSQRMLDIIRQSGSNISALPPGLVTSGFSSCYSRLDSDRPSTTLTVNFVHPASNRCIHPWQDRALTLREGARLQSFPDRFHFLGTQAQIAKQIGNAVPPLLGRVLAEAILDADQTAGRRQRRHGAIKKS